MSIVTNAILVHHLGEKPVPGSTEEEGLYLLPARLNEELQGIGVGWFTPVSRSAGGRKYLECELHVAAFNGRDVERPLIDAIRSLPWEAPDCVQLFLKRQDEDRFTEVDLGLTRGDPASSPSS